MWVGQGALLPALVFTMALGCSFNSRSDRDFVRDGDDSQRRERDKDPSFCEQLCPEAGGTCDGDVCEIACGPGQAGCNRPVCPSGLDCRIRCEGATACQA